MKLTLILITAAILCSCAKQPPVLHLLHYDAQNNRVDEQGNLIPWTNWGIGVIQGTNVIKILEAQEK